jgi:hypothetical protein
MRIVITNAYDLVEDLDRAHVMLLVHTHSRVSMKSQVPMMLATAFHTSRVLMWKRSGARVRRGCAYVNHTNTATKNEKVDEVMKC